MLGNLTAAILCRIDHYRPLNSLCRNLTSHLALLFHGRFRTAMGPLSRARFGVPARARAVEDRELSDVFHRLAMWWVILSHEIEDDPRPATSQGMPFARKPVTGAEPDTFL